MMRTTTAAEKRAWLTAHPWLWQAMPTRHTREAAGYLGRLRCQMVQAEFYSRKTTDFDVEVSIFHLIATLRRTGATACA